VLDFRVARVRPQAAPGDFELPDICSRVRFAYPGYSLKQSLLQKAFSGELTAGRAEEELESATT